MDEKIVAVLNEMSEYLSISQMKKLQEVILKTFSENEVKKTDHSNLEYLQLFIEAKRIEGCSERTIQYYGIEVALLAGKKYPRGYKDLKNRVTAVSSVANIPEIQDQREFIRKILNTDYLERAGMEDFEEIRERLRSLMKYIPTEERNTYITHFTDEILSMDWNKAELDNDELKNYKERAEFYIREHQDNIVIAKLKTNKPLTENDIDSLEEILWKEIGTKQDYENEIGQKPLGEFVREIVGLDMNAAKEAFSAYLSDTNMDSRQIYFVNQIIEYIVHNGILKDLSVLQESPFTDQGSIVDIFTDLSVWMGIRGVIDRINANAAA